MKYTIKELEKIGQNVASLWGAECLDFEIKGNEVTFKCIEYGEIFITTLTGTELKQYL